MLYHQVMVWAWTAVDLAGIEPSQLVVHATGGCDQRLRRDLEALGARWVPVRAHGEGTPMCNKLAQLESAVLLDHGRLVLSDCDLAWRAPIPTAAFGDRPRAKVVDLANPPLELLRPLFAEAGFPDAATAAVSLGGAPTYHNNCNGGLYLLSGEWLRRLQEPWPRWVRWVDARRERLGPHGWHVFQIAFALAMEELGVRVEHLPLTYNLPTHVAGAEPDPRDLPIRALHFHRAFGPGGLLRPTGEPTTDAAIAEVNAVVRRRAVDAWWLPDTIVLDGVHGQFRTRRIDHVTRQLEEFGAHTRNELAMLLSHLRPGDQVIDVGAHIGTFTVAFGRTVGSGGRVLAIEPGAEPFALLEENIQRNGVAGWARASHALVTDRAGRFRAVETPDHTSATHYLEDADAPPIPCLALDALAADLRPDRPLRLIKIDVEGMELSVLHSARALIRRHRPLLYLEVVAAQLARYGVRVDDVEAFLRAEGYAFYRNVGPRNSTGDDYAIAPLASLADGGTFFDCLAIPAHPG